MKRFFNSSTCVMLAVIVIAVISAALSSPINWTAIIWMVIAAMWVVCARSNQMTSEDWKDLYNALKRLGTSTNNELTAFKEKYRTLKNDYLKIAKQNEAISNENAQLHVRVDDLRNQNSEYAEKYQALDNEYLKLAKEHEATVKENAQTLEAKEPGTKTTKREYTEQDQARIREEMKAAGMKPKAKKRRPVEDDD